MVFRSSCPFESPLTAVCALPEYQSDDKYKVYSNILGPCKYILYFRPDLCACEVRLELYGANAVGGPTLPSSALASLPPSFLSSLPRFLLPPLPHFLHPASLPPHRPSSFFSPSRWFVSSCKTSNSYVILICFKYKMPTRLVHSVNHCLEKLIISRISGETMFIRFMY